MDGTEARAVPFTSEDRREPHLMPV